MAGTLEVVETADASQRYWFQVGSRKSKLLSCFEELGVGKNTDLRRAGSVSNIVPLVEVEENWEELFKQEQSKSESLEEHISHLEEKCQDVSPHFCFRFSSFFIIDFVLVVLFANSAHSATSG